MAKHFYNKELNEIIQFAIETFNVSQLVEIAKLKLEVKQLKNEIVNVRLGNSERWAALENKYKQAREIIEKAGL